MKRKKYDPILKRREHAHTVASKYIISGVADLDGAVFLYDGLMRNVFISKQTAALINKVKHNWSFSCCVAGRYKNGKVWVRVAHHYATIQAYAEEVSPLVTEALDEFFNEQDPNTRLCKWWVARAKLDYSFTAEEMMHTAYRADVFRAFRTKYEDDAGMEYGNHPPAIAGKDFTIDQFKAWWDANRSPRSMIQELWVEE